MPVILASWGAEIVKFKIFNEARVNEKENEPTSTDWMGLY
jgi:hypothetical protein